MSGVAGEPGVTRNDSGVSSEVLEKSVGASEDEVGASVRTGGTWRTWRDRQSRGGDPENGRAFAERISFFLFRRRTFFLLAAPIAMVIFGKPELLGFLIGLGLVVLGQVIRIWSAGHLVKSEVLTVSGPFSRVRNPLYIGSMFITWGYCAMTSGWLVWVILVPTFFAFHGAAVIWEERFLLEQFGDEFKAYCKKVPRVIPSLTARIESNGRFSLKQARLNKEDKTILGTVIIVIAFGIKMMLGI